MSPTGRGTDPLDHLRLQCSEGNVVATSVAKAAIEFVQARIAELDRKAKAFDAINRRLVFIDAVTNTGERVEWSAWPDETRIPSQITMGRDLLTAIESALEETR